MTPRLLPLVASVWRPRSVSVCVALVTTLALAACSDEPGTTGGVKGSDAGGSDAVLFDAGTQVDSGAQADASVDTTTASDTSASADATSSVDSTSADIATSSDTAVVDTVSVDSGVPDAGATDAGTTDAGTTDAGTTDAGGGSDAGAADAAVTDAGDASASDAAAPDAGAVTWGSFTPLGCKKFVNKNTTGTVNPYISPARDGQFYVSWVQKGGDLMLNWEAPTSCKTTVGPLQVNTTKGTVYYWGGIAVVSDTSGNFYAVWESLAKGADIALSWSKDGKTFTKPLELVSTSTNGQDPALWVADAGTVHAAWRGHHPTKKQYDPYFATSKDLFTTKKFSAGVGIQDDAAQDDQVAIAADSKGHLYFAYQSHDGDIFAAKSTDTGKTWSKPVQVNDVKGKANVGKASFLVVTPDDRVVLMWSDERKKKSGNENDVFADSSKDGLTWGTDVQVNDNDKRYQQDPSMAVGTGAGCKGAIYAVWQDFRNKKSYDVYAARSTDGGLTWSKNEAVAKDLEGDEMNPAIAVDKACVIGVAWRDSTKSSAFDIGLTFLKW